MTRKGLTRRPRHDKVVRESFVKRERDLELSSEVYHGEFKRIFLIEV